MRGLNIEIDFYRKIGSVFIKNSTAMCAVQEDNSDSTADSRISNHGLFNQAWITTNIGIDVLPNDRARMNIPGGYIEYIVQNSVLATGSRVPHIDLVCKRNSLKDSAAEKIYKLTINAAETDYDSILEEYYGDRSYTEEEINAIVFDNIDNNVIEFPGGTYGRVYCKIIVEAGAVLENDTVRIRDKNYKIQKITANNNFTDEVECYQTDK